MSSGWAKAAIRRRIVLFWVLIPLSLWGKNPAWFRVRGMVGASERVYSAILYEDSVPVFKGVHREAPEWIAEQTYGAYKMVFQAWYAAPDSVFSWSLSAIVRSGKEGLQPVWVNAVRQGMSFNEWVFWSFRPSVSLRFHSPIYGDGVHEGLDAMPEELLWLEARRLWEERRGGDVWRVLASLTEESYVRRSWMVRGTRTELKMRMDGVDCGLVRFEREDGAIMEVWLSLRGLQIMKIRSFRGTWFERFQ